MLDKLRNIINKPTGNKPPTNIYKTLPLFLSSILSIFLLIISTLRYIFRNNLLKEIGLLIQREDISIDEVILKLSEALNTDLYDSMGLIIGIIGIAVSVWVGLNIYNVIERKDIEEFYTNISDKVNSLDSKYNESYNQWEKQFNESLKKFDDKQRIRLLSDKLKRHEVDTSTIHYIEYFEKNLPRFSDETIEAITGMDEVLSKYDTDISSADQSETLTLLEKIKRDYIIANNLLLKVSSDPILSGFYDYKMAGALCRTADNMYRLGSNLNTAKKYLEEALKLYKKSANKDSNLTSVDNGIGFSYLRLAQIGDEKHDYYVKKAIKHLKSACEVNPKFEQAFRNLGAAYEEDKRIDDAIEEYKKATNISPKSENAHNCLASAYLKKVNSEIKFFDRKKVYNRGDYNLEKAKRATLREYVLEAKKHAHFLTLLNPSKIDGYYRLIEAYTFFKYSQ